MLRDILDLLERNGRYRAVYVGEPQLGKRGLYPQLSVKGSAEAVREMMNLLAYADGELDLIGISDVIGVPARELVPDRRAPARGRGARLEGRGLTRGGDARVARCTKV